MSESQQLPLPDPDKNQSVPPVPVPPVPDPLIPTSELDDYSPYLRQHYHSGVVYFRATDLMSLLSTSRLNPLHNAEEFTLTAYLEEVHRNALANMERKIKDSSNYELARTDHEQLTSLVAGLIPVAKEVAPNSAKILERCVFQARQLDLTAKRLWKEYRESRERGNVRFVDKLSVNMRRSKL